MAQRKCTFRVPKPTIYMRDKFLVKPGLHSKFFEGQDALLRHMGPDIELIAGCNSGATPLRDDQAPPHPLPHMMHVWRLPKWDTLYSLMWSFSETDWYS